MTNLYAYKLINKIIKEGNIESGVFITLLSKAYIHAFDIKRDDFINILNKTLQIEEKKERNDQ